MNPGSSAQYTIKIRVNDQDLPPNHMSIMQSVTVQEDLDALNMVTLVLYNRDAEDLEKLRSDDPLFTIGNKVEIGFGYGDDVSKIIEVEITSLEPIFQSGDAPTLTVRGYDYRHRLMRGRQTRTFAKMKDSAIAQQIAQAAGIRMQVEDTKVALDYVMQHNQTDWEFLQKRADRIGYELSFCEDVLYFQPQQNGNAAAIELSLDLDITEFSPRLTSMAQSAEVNVRGWDAKEKKAILSKAAVGQETAKMGGATSGPKMAQQAFGKSTVASVTLPVQSQAEADQIALGQFNGMALGYIQGDLTTQGNPDLHVNTVVDIVGAGTTFSGPYYVTSATHSVTPDEGYTTSLTVERNAAG